MRKVSCAHCRFEFAAHEEEVGSDVVCPNCNTRQRVESDAALLLPKPMAPHPVMSYLSRQARPPEYSLVIIAGILLMTVGVVTIITGFAMAFENRREQPFLIALQGGIGGILMMGFGQLLFCVRDIARNTWRDVR